MSGYISVGSKRLNMFANIGTISGMRCFSVMEAKVSGHVSNMKISALDGCVRRSRI